MTEDHRRGKDEMNLAVLPIARLGRNDHRTRIEYRGTFKEPGREQEKMVWIVEGAAGLPTEFAERVLVALLYIGSEQNFTDRRMTFTVYRVLKVLGLAISNRNYRLVETALKQLTGVLITTDKAWIEYTSNNEQKRVTTSRGFHIVDEYYLHYQGEEEEGQESYILWGARVWKSMQAGYLKLLDVDFYYSLKNPIARRLYRFLDKMMAYDPVKPYQIDIFDLANKLGMAAYEHAAHLRRPLKVAAQELVDRNYLSAFEFFKVGPFSRIQFYKTGAETVQPFTLLEEEITPRITPPEIIKRTPEEELWASILDQMTPTHAKLLREVHLVCVENGVAIIDAGYYVDWMQNRMVAPLRRALQNMQIEVTDVRFIRGGL